MDITIRKGQMEDLQTYISFLHEIKQAMPNSDWFFIDPDDETHALMEAGCLEFWLAEAGSRTAGVFSIIHPGLRPFNLGYDLDFSEEMLRRVVHMDTAAVHPDFRGLQLQNRLMAEAEKEISRQERRILLCTVHPENRYSLQNVLKQGYTIKKELEKYGNIRCILRKDLPGA